MSYNLRYTLDFNITQDDRQPTIFETATLEIYEKDGTESPETILGVENPVQITYQNNSERILEPFIGSEATLNLIATEDFQLQDLYTEDEQRWLINIKRDPGTYDINWSIDETPIGGPVDMDLEIFLNGSLIVQKFTNDLGTFKANKGDIVLVKAYASGPSSGGIPGMNVNITGIPSQRTVVYPFSIDIQFTVTGETNIETFTTYSNTVYTAIRSAIFNPTQNVNENIAYTKEYTSLISQSDAQNQADTDSLFNSEGQAYADSNYNVKYVIWRGFIIPDGCQESFTFTPYTISANAVDTLGLLKNLSYVQNDGNFWLGKQTYIEVIYNCLNRVQIPDMDIYTCVNVTEESYPTLDSDDPLALTYVNAETYLKDDNINPLDCQEVLDKVLRLWTAVIIQSEGAWYIFRPNEMALTDTLIFRQYTAGAYVGTVTKTIGQVWGGHTEGATIAPLFHTGTDQLKMIEKPFKNNSMAWKYGTNYNLTEELDNPTFAGFSRGCVGDPELPCDDVTIPGWTKTGTMFLGTYLTGGLIFFSDDGTYPTLTNYYENDNLITVVRNSTVTDRVRFTIDYLNYDPLFATDMNFVISLTDGAIVWYLQADFSWAITAVEPGINYFQVRSDVGDGGTLIIESNPVPSGGNITFRILAPSGTIRDIVYTSISAGVFNDPGVQVGEIHTATQTGNYTFVPDTIEVLNGDSDTALYMGAMYETDQTTLTSNWYRKYAGESVLSAPFATYKPLIRLAVEEKERMHARPYIKFDGTIFGYFNPLSRFVINLLSGYFMPIKMNYDIQANTTQTTLRRIINEEIEQDYTLEPDYGKTTKVLVK